jgi:RHS repeat-associated protein
MRLGVRGKTLASLLILGVALLLPGARAQSPGAPSAVIPGQSVTLLPDGRWLLVGGQGAQGPLGTASIFDPETTTTTPVTQPLLQARAGHTATVLADGSVLIVGGFGSGGHVVSIIEHFDVPSQAFHLVPATGMTPRAHQTATLLTDGRILVAGGTSSQGQMLGDAQLFNPLTFAVEAVPAPLSTPRQGATAGLLPDGRVLIWGGTDATGAALTTGEVFDPAQPGFAGVTVKPVTPDPNDSPGLEASIPLSGSVGVATDGLLALRFSKPLRVDPTTAGTVTLTGPSGPEAATVVAAEGGRLVFVTPGAPLMPGSTYSLTVNGAVDTMGLLVPFTSVSFLTAAPAATTTGGIVRAPTPAAATGHFHPVNAVRPGAPGETDEWEWHGPLCDGKPCSRWQKLPPLKAPRGVTALSGQMLRLNGEPLAQATLKIGARSARTDGTGRFLLTGIAGGDQVLVMDGSTANRPGRSYAIFEYYVDIEAGETTVLPFTIWMPLLDTRHATAIPVPTPGPMVATSPLIPGLEVRIPGNVILRTSGGPLRSIPLTRIPVDRPPFPVPQGSTFSFTPQAHGALVQRPDGTPNPAGVRIILPNHDGLPAGTRVGLQSYEPAKGWFVYGQGMVSADGAQIIPDAGVEFHRVTCFFPLGPESNFAFAATTVGGVRGGEPVDLATGIFTMEKTDLVLPDVIPIVIRREYRQNDAVRRNGEYGPSQSFFYQMMLAGDFTTFSFADLVLANGAKVHYRRTSSGTDKVSAVMEHTGTVGTPVTPTGFYASVLRWNAARPGWDITFTDGTIYQFAAIGHLGTPLTGIQDRVGNQLTVSRTGIGTYGDFITRITSPNGRWVDFSNDMSSGNVLQIRDNLGRTVSYAYDASYRLQTVTDAGGGVTTYSYHPQGAPYALIQTITDARNILYLTNGWDLQKRRITSQTQADGTTFQFAYTVDGTGKITQTDMTDPRGTVRRVTFNGSGYAVTDTRAQGTPIAQTRTYVREATGNLVTSMTDALGRRTDLAYDGKGSLLSQTRLAGTAAAVTTSATYEPTFNRVTSVTDPLGHQRTFGYDSLGNMTTLADPLSQVTTLTYNAAGQPLTIATPAGTTVLGYDRGDVVTITDPVGNTTTRFTDDGGRLASLSTPVGQRTSFEYDALNQLRKITDPMNGQTQLSYDPNGNLLLLSDARGGATSYAYDGMDRVTVRSDALLRPESYGYDGNGNPTTLIDRKGQGMSRTYDPLDRLTQVSYQDGSTITFTWDAGNRLTQIVDSLAGAITRDYDARDRLTQEVTPQGTMRHAYDAAGRRTSMTVVGQPTVHYAYDGAERPIQITQGAATASMAYDAAGRRTSVTLSNGLRTTYTWDAASRLTGLTYRNGPDVLGTLAYGYDATGNRTLLGGTWARPALPEPVASATYDAANRQLTFGSRTLSYDPNGNLTSDGTTAYTWDARNRLIALTGAGVTASFSYDPLGRRTGKTIDGTATGFLYDGLNPVQERQGDGATAYLLTGLGIDEYLTRTDAAGTRYFLADALGSTIALSDDAGTTQTTYTYEAFGATTAAGQPDANSYQHTGRENDGTGLRYYRARYYHPQLQRFVAEDPIRFRGGVNFYSYVANNPLRWIDPLGLDVTISLWSCCLGFDHIGIGVNTDDTVGFYPVRLNHPFDRGRIASDLERHDFELKGFQRSMTIKTNPEQDRLIQAYIDQRRADPGRYNVFSGRHCGDFVQEALRAGGIDPFPQVLSPLSVYEGLRVLMDDNMDFTQGVSRQAR